MGAVLSRFDVVSMKAFTYLDDRLIASDTDKDGILILEDYPAGLYRIALKANEGIKGDFVVQTKCSSKEPTPAATNYPSQSPLILSSPTKQVKQPTLGINVVITQLPTAT